MRKLAWIALTAAVAVVVPAAAAAKVVVVRSVGPSAKVYPPGKALPDSASIKLGNGDAVTLLGPSASRTLRGPGTFPATTAGRSSLAMTAGRRSRFGAMRSGEITSAPSLWDVDVTQAGTICIAEPAKLKLWRPNADSAATLNIRGGGAAQAVEFAAGHATVPWPAQLPIANDREFELELAGSGDRSTIRFAMVNAPPADLVAAAELLIAKGCQNQLDLLVETADKAD
ncbi:MAG TPA: hypothetical protein VMN38_05480 [Sphingomicrobium sp.]|nr:hypothetical protein [Sphingomicrobium sp.]